MTSATWFSKKLRWRLNPVFAFGLTEAQWFGGLAIIVGLWQLLKSGAVTAKSTA